MLGRVAGFVAAAYALGANGILLPPGVNAIDDSLSFGAETAAQSQLVRIPCPECAFSTKEAHADGQDGSDDAFRIEGGANDLLLNFTTSEDSRRIELNGAVVYPPQVWSKQPEVIVHQVPASGDGVKVPLHVTSSGLFMGARQPDEEEETGLVTVEYAVYGLEMQLMEIQPVKIDLLRVGALLHIMRIELVGDAKPAPSPPSPQHGPPMHFGPPFGGPPRHGPRPPPDMTNEKECSTLPAPICRFRYMLEAKIAHLRHKRPCPGQMGPPHAHGRLPSHVRPPLPHLPAHGEHPHGHLGRPHHMRPWHGHHHHGHHHHRFTGAFVRGFVAVLIPVVAGISVGLAVSLIGLVVGRIITVIWTRCARQGQQGSARMVREAEFVEESKGLMLADEEDEDYEVLPAYEDAPAYEESDEKFSY